MFALLDEWVQYFLSFTFISFCQLLREISSLWLFNAPFCFGWSQWFVHREHRPHITENYAKKVSKTFIWPKWSTFFRNWKLFLSLERCWPFLNLVLKCILGDRITRGQWDTLLLTLVSVVHLQMWTDFIAVMSLPLENYKLNYKLLTSN